MFPPPYALTAETQTHGFASPPFGGFAVSDYGLLLTRCTVTNSLPTILVPQSRWNCEIRFKPGQIIQGGGHPAGASPGDACHGSSASPGEATDRSLNPSDASARSAPVSGCLRSQRRPQLRLLPTLARSGWRRYPLNWPWLHKPWVFVMDSGTRGMGQPSKLSEE